MQKKKGHIHGIVDRVKISDAFKIIHILTQSLSKSLKDFYSYRHDYPKI